MTAERITGLLPRASALLVSSVGAVLLVEPIGAVSVSTNLAMSRGVAVTLVALGAAIWLSIGWRRPAARRAGLSLAAAIALLGAATLLAPDAMVGEPLTRPLAVTVVAFTLLGVSLAALDIPRVALMASAIWPAAAAHVIALASIFYAAVPSSSMPWAMPLVCAIVLAVAAVGIVFVRSEQSLPRLIVSDSAGGVVMRRLLLTIPLLAPVVATLVQRAAAAGLFAPQLAIPTAALLSMALMMAFVLWQVTLLHRLDLQRQRAVFALSQSNDALTLRVEQRAARLAAARAEIKQLEGLVPVCEHCRRVRVDAQYWRALESYFSARAKRAPGARCGECASEGDADVHEPHVRPVEIEAVQIAAEQPIDAAADADAHVAA